MSVSLQLLSEFPADVSHSFSHRMPHSRLSTGKNEFGNAETSLSSCHQSDALGTLPVHAIRMTERVLNEADAG